MSLSQPGILAPLLPHSRYLEFALAPGADPRPVLATLATRAVDADAVIGLGPGLVRGIGELRPFPSLSGADCEVPSTQADLWLWQRGDDRGRIFHQARAFAHDAAPAAAHVKRTAQESVTPEAFILRRSMPWADGEGAGLMFVAFGKSFDAFEAQIRRMAGDEDQITDALFRFTQPLSGSYFWCPPVAAGKLDLSALGL